MDTAQLSLNLRNSGINRAVEHADVTHDDWSTQAYSLFETYVRYISFQETFQIEDFRDWARGRRLPEPPSKRAFGFIPLKAARAGLIEKHGYAQVSNPKAHMANATVWRRK